MRLGRGYPTYWPHSRLWPPQKVLPVPLQREQTVRVTLAVSHRRVTEKRRMPLQGWEGSRTATTGFKVSVLGTIERLLGPEPPEVVLANVPQYLQTITVRCQAIRTRRDLKRRVPPQWLEPSGTKTQGSGSQTLGAFEYPIGPMPPAVILPLPSQQQQTVKTWVLTAAERRRLIAAVKAKPRLIPPIPPTPVIAPVETTLHVHLVPRRTQRSAQRFLRPPAVMPLEFRPLTPLIKSLVPRRQDWRRYTLKILWAPAVVRPPFPVETTIHTRFAVEERRIRKIRGTMHSLTAPFEVPVPTPTVSAAPFRTLMGVGR